MEKTSLEQLDKKSRKTKVFRDNLKHFIAWRTGEHAARLSGRTFCSLSSEIIENTGFFRFDF